MPAWLNFTQNFLNESWLKDPSVTATSGFSPLYRMAHLVLSQPPNKNLHIYGFAKPYFAKL